MDGDFLKLSQFSYHSHQPPYNSYPSPLGTLTSPVNYAIPWGYFEIYIKKIWYHLNKEAENESIDPRVISRILE